MIMSERASCTKEVKMRHLIWPIHAMLSYQERLLDTSHLRNKRGREKGKAKMRKIPCLTLT